MSNYTFIEATANIKSQPGKLKGIFVSGAGGTVAVYDTQTTTKNVTVIGTFTPAASTNYNFFDGINVDDGIYVEITGAISATIYFE
jgi:hypothetical protein